MRGYTLIMSLLFITAFTALSGCSNPLREKSQCEKLCEQMHSECTVGCPADYYDPTCHSRCDTSRDCRETCDKPLYREGDDSGDTGDSGDNSK